MDIDSSHFVVIFGPPAVGKMTVAYALAEKTKGKVFHNHLSIELLLPFFSFGSPSFSRLNTLIRKSIFEEIAKSDIPVFIFTFVWALNQPQDQAYIEEICSLFREEGWRCHFVELEADLEERLLRNASAFRLSKKISKRDVAASEQRLMHHEKGSNRFQSNGDFCFPEDHLKINNTTRSSSEVAEEIISFFDL